MRILEDCLTRKEVFALFGGCLLVIACFYMGAHLSEYLSALFLTYTFALVMLILEHQPLFSKDNLVLSTLLLTGTFAYCHATSESTGCEIVTNAFWVGTISSVALTVLACRKQESNLALIRTGIITLMLFLFILLFIFLFLYDKKMLANLMVAWSVSAFGYVFINFFERKFYCN